MYLSASVRYCKIIIPQEQKTYIPKWTTTTTVFLLFWSGVIEWHLASVRACVLQSKIISLTHHTQTTYFRSVIIYRIHIFTRTHVRLNEGHGEASRYIIIYHQLSSLNRRKPPLLSYYYSMLLMMSLTSPNPNHLILLW